MTDRADLAETLEIVGEMFEDERIPALLAKIKSGQTVMQFNAIIVQISAAMLKHKKTTADKLIAAHKKISIEDVEKIPDKEYAKELKDAITVDVLGFFA